MKRTSATCAYFLAYECQLRMDVFDFWCGHLQREQWGCYINCLVGALPWEGEWVEAVFLTHTVLLALGADTKGRACRAEYKRLTSTAQASSSPLASGHTSDRSRSRSHRSYRSRRSSICRYGVLNRVCVVHIQPGKHILLMVLLIDHLASIQ